MPTLEERYNENGASLEERYNSNESYWRTRLAGQGELKAPPPKSLWRHFVDNIDETMRRGPANLIAGRIAPLIETGDNKTYEERRQAFAAKENQRRKDYDAVNVPQSKAEVAADVAGSLVGSLISDPTNLIGGPSKNLLPRMATAAGIGGGADIAQQGLDIAEGFRDEYDPTQTLINAGASPLFVAAAHGLGKAWDRFGPTAGAEDPSVGNAQSPVEDPIDIKIRKLDDLANHPNTPKAEAKAARSMADKLRKKYGRPGEPIIEDFDFSPPETRGPLTIQDAADVGKKFGTVTSTVRSAAHNKAVGGVPNSYHVKGRAMDIARRAGVSHKQIEAALRKAGYNIIESIDEGDHSHFAFDFKKSGTPTVQEQTQTALANIEQRAQSRASEVSGRMVNPFEDTGPYQEEDLPTSLTDVISGEDLQRLVDGPHRGLVRDLLEEYHSPDLPNWRRDEIHRGLQDLNTYSNLDEPVLNEPIAAFRDYQNRTGLPIGPLTRTAVENVASNHGMDLDRAARMFIRGLERGPEQTEHPFVREVRQARDVLAEASMSPEEFAAYKALPNKVLPEEPKILEGLPENAIEFPQSRIVGSETGPRLIISKIKPSGYDDNYITVIGKAVFDSKEGKLPEWSLPHFHMTIDKESGHANIDIGGAASNKLGPAELRTLSEQIAKRFPMINSIGGLRVTGVRGKFHTEAPNSVNIGRLRSRSQKVPENLPENVARINQKEIEAQIAAKEQAMRDVEERQTTQLNNLLKTLDTVYNDIRDGNVYLTQQEISEMRDDSFIDSMVRQLDGKAFPKGSTAVANEDLIREIAARFDEIENTAEGIRDGLIPVRQKPQLQVIEGGKKEGLVEQVRNTVTEILNNDEGSFRPSEAWRTFADWRARKAAHEASVGGPAGPADPVVGALDRLFKAVKLAKKATPEQKAAYHAERSARVGRAAGRGQHTSGIAGLRAEKSELAGELPKIDLEPIRDQFTPEEIDSIMDDIKSSRKLSYLEGVTTRDAVDELLNGKLPTPSEISLIYRVYPQLVDSIMKQRSLGDKAKNLLKMAWETTRGSMGSGDISFSGRQGFMMISRPQWWKSTIKQFAALPDTKGKEVLDEQVERIVNHPLYDHLKKMGIELMDTGGHGNRDEYAVHNLAEHKYSPIGPVVRGSNRAYTYMANELRPQLALDILSKHQENGVNINDEDYLKTLGEYINTFTGRGKFNNKVLDSVMPAMNLVMFAPRFVLSTFKRFSPFLWAKMLKHPAILKEAARDTGAYLATLFGVLALADYNGFEVKWDIRSPTGLKIKHGDTTYDVGAGLVQTANLLSKLGTLSKVTGKGKEQSLRNVKFGEDDAYDTWSTFFRTKLHPSLGYLVDAATGKNVVGENFDVIKDTAKLFLPLSTFALAEHIKNVGPGGAAAIPFAMFGGGVNTFKPKEPDKKASLESRFKGERGGSLESKFKEKGKK